MHFKNSKEAKEAEMEWQTGRLIEAEVRHVKGQDLAVCWGCGKGLPQGAM